MACIPCWNSTILFGFSRWSNFLDGFEDAVGDGGGFYGGADVVSAEDVGSTEDGGHVGGGGGVEAVFHRGSDAVEQDGE